ncbi:class I SAM-dependent methyltransferase [Romeria aff. gracilis LEGE 07310]|uniref:Class I SAM-dependent methyltransferase n=1 Tax=Vasconcelosia minhoensis LEGE 07310 TaxID=915328 RepID=A0A8J7A574_9CYAN|nr:class I SAM-dependent methyltransferase [Romeria gracilis]MBE9076607.1 class I SAM-dependent methyltransferase [Romeria aff. gracilis LEGE 07310]
MTADTLTQTLVQRIQQSPQQQISFADFMALALYHPQQGYYSTRDAVIGPQGDFITSPHMGHDFGELLAEQFAQMWQILGQPQPFTLVEMGAGQGLVAADVFAYLQRQHPACFAALQYIVVEKSAALRAAQQQRLRPWAEQGKLSWCELTQLSADSITGCAFSNELVDAFPVHWVELHAGQLWEVYVATDGATPFKPVLQPASQPLKAYFERLGIDFTQGYPDGYRTEVNLAALDWLSAIAARLRHGYLLTIDYGYPAHRYYSPARNQGTLQCYSRHRHHDDPFSAVGEQDITAHVDFTTLEQAGKAAGLKTIGFTQQGLFLMALGLGDRIAGLSQATVADSPAMQQLLRRRGALHQLMNPMGLGNFGVLVQSKGLLSEEMAQPLQGLTVPPMAGSAG